MKKIIVADINNRSWTRNAFVLSFGAYGDTHVLVYENSLDDALESAAEALRDNGLVGIFHDVESEEDETDMTYTEAGWLASWEWNVSGEWRHDNPSEAARMRTDLIARFANGH